MMLITRYKIIRGIENDRPTASLFVKRDWFSSIDWALTNSIVCLQQ
jgi:hypothetical protein